MYGAVDIGGTKTLVAVFNDACEVVDQVKFSTPANYEVFLEQLASSVANLSTNDFWAVGVAAPGKINHKQGLLVAAGNLSWKNIPIQADFEKIFHAPIALENDAKAATVAEAIAAGPKYPKVVYITISTGVGIGVCENGKLIPELLDAEPGWMSVEHKGEMVPWEKISSGKALVAATNMRASELEDPIAWDTHARNISKGLIAIIAIIQPDLIVVGGGVGNHLQKFEAPLLKYLKQYENPLVPIPPIRKATHPEEAVIYGCYELAKDATPVIK
jgi:predicted NBD/HSP70 family sugar kinase